MTKNELENTDNLPPIKETVKKEAELKETAIEELKKPDLLLNIVKEVQNEGIIGEKGNIRALAILLTIRKVKNAIPTSGNVVVSGKSGYGKDAIVDKTCRVMIAPKDYVDMGGQSAKTIEYWATGKFKDWNWNEKVLKKTDPTADDINSDCTKSFASGKSTYHTVIDMEHKEIEIKGKPVLIFTSYQTSINVEGERRWKYLYVDESENTDENVIDDIFNNATVKNIDKIINKGLREGLQNHLMSYNVIIPFANQIRKYFPKKLMSSRTKAKTFIDYIKASTVLHQYQREKLDDDTLIAIIEDYDNAVKIWNGIDKEQYSLNSREKELIRCIVADKSQAKTWTEIQKETKLSRDWLQNNESKLKERGIICIEEKEVQCGTSTKTVTAWYLCQCLEYKPMPYSKDFEQWKKEQRRK